MPVWRGSRDPQAPLGVCLPVHLPAARLRSPLPPESPAAAPSAFCTKHRLLLLPAGLLPSGLGFLPTVPTPSRAPRNPQPQTVRDTRDEVWGPGERWVSDRGGGGPTGWRGGRNAGHGQVRVEERGGGRVGARKVHGAQACTEGTGTQPAREQGPGRGADEACWPLGGGVGRSRGIRVSGLTRVGGQRQCQGGGTVGPLAECTWRGEGKSQVRSRWGCPRGSGLQKEGLAEVWGRLRVGGRGAVCVRAYVRDGAPGPNPHQPEGAGHSMTCAAPAAPPAQPKPKSPSWPSSVRRR